MGFLLGNKCLEGGIEKDSEAKGGLEEKTAGIN